MKTFFKIRYLALVALVAAALSLAACDNGPATLSFQGVAKSVTNISGVTASTIDVFTSAPPENLLALSPEDQVAVRSVDYSQYFVILVTFGWGYAYQDSITDIIQFKNVIWVKTTLEESSTEGGANYQVVKVPKDELIHYGKITFRLLHHLMGELGRTVQTIQAP
ncbi:MAG TPA: hypothetical protein VMB24_04465 [Dehalococcoidales bacterium]|nr:hypothetical protein [Dehalococcoidales bacterium]